jgi:Tol biopolymer transport system component
MSRASSFLRVTQWTSLLLVLATPSVTGQRIQSSKSPFGKTPPATPVLFAPGVISIAAATTYRPAFTPDGHTVYYTMEVGNDYLILVSRFKNGRWTQPKIASFSGKYSDAEPFLAPDGSKLFFASKRPIEGDKPKKDYDLWMVERLASGRWSAPQHLGDSINTDAHELYPAVTADGTLYFSRFGPGGIWRSRHINGHYEPAEKLGAPINAELKEAGVYVAPDGRYMIFEAKDPKGLGGTDFYISYSQSGTWTSPRNLGAPINSSAEETCAMVSPDGRYLFFTSSRKLPNTEVALGKGLTYPAMLARLNSLGRGRWHIYYVGIDNTGIK